MSGLRSLGLVDNSDAYSPLGVVGRSPQGSDTGVGGVMAPSTREGGTGSVTLVAGTEYSARAFVPKTMKFSGVTFILRNATGNDDPVFVVLRDSQGNIIATRATAATGVMATAGRKTVSFDSPVIVEGGSTVYASILVPTFISTAPQLWGWNPAVSAPFQMGGTAMGQVEALAKTGRSTPQTTLSSSDTTGLTPFLFLADDWGQPIRAWENAALTTISPFVGFNGLSQGSQLSFVTDTPLRVASTRTMKCIVRPGDVQAGTSSTGERCEVGALPYAEKSGDAFWYAFSAYLPSDWVHTSELPAGITTPWAILMQIHTSLPSPPGPVFAITVRPDGMYANISGGEQSVSGNVYTVWEREVNRLCDSTLGAWHDFVLHAEFGPLGSYDLFHRLGTEDRFKRVFSRRNVPNVVWANGAGSGAAYANYAKLGLYRSAASFTSTLYHAGLRRGRTLSEVMGLFGHPEKPL